MKAKWAAAAGTGSALFMLLYPHDVMAGAQEACRLWALAVMPGLLPFLVCLIYAAGRMPLPQGRGCRVTGLSRAGRRVMLMGWITGSPGGARLMKEAARRGLLTRQDGVRLAVYTGTMSPMFLLGTLPLWLSAPGWGWKLLAAHWGGVWAAGEVARLFPVGQSLPPQGEAPEAMTLPGAIESACRAMLTVCGCMVMGCVMTRLVGAALPLGDGTLLNCLMEVTGGCEGLIRKGWPVWLLPGAVSLGGLALFLQNLAFWPRGWVNPLWVLLGRVLACLFSCGLGALVMAGETAPAFAPGPLPLAHPSLAWLVGYLILCLIPLAVKQRR